MCTADLFLGLLAILFPPLPVWVKCGICSVDSIINILLCMLGYIPGTLHSWYIISKFPETYEYEAVPPDGEPGHVYVFVQQPEPQPQPQPQPHPDPKPSSDEHSSPSHPNYGSISDAAPSSSAGPANGDHHEDGPAAPPTYAEAVKGDNKIQTHD